MKVIEDKILKGQRLTVAESMELAADNDLHRLGFLASVVRKRLHPEAVVTYIIDRNINYTDICIAGCKFCAFFKTAEESGGSVLSFDQLSVKINETKELNGVRILLQGGLHPDKPFEFYEAMVRFIKEHDIHIHGFSPPEIYHFAGISGLSTKEVLRKLQKAGLNSMPGGGAEILSDRVRKEIAPRKCSAKQWLDIMSEAHQLGVHTTATMMFGHVETMEERLQHLASIRSLQDCTAGFTAFIPWPFQPTNTKLSHLPAASSFEYLKMLALSRIFLDNVPDIQASWVTQGPKIAQLALLFGANDFGSTMIEENVVAATGVNFKLSEKEICRLIAGAGFEPRQRSLKPS